MTIYPACMKQWDLFVRGILKRAEMDAAVSQLIEQTGQNWRYVRASIDPAMNTQNKIIQRLLREYLKCACPIYMGEREAYRFRG